MQRLPEALFGHEVTHEQLVAGSAVSNLKQVPDGLN